ncbi:hypothetical protein HLRTI_003176 [Halorhabdus tiamatea SARL4B]|uniref:Uncharacterized protein n=1 Tax=Halorhabdus tiamatea SARL4B TaxID=1033806 RepID=U2DYG0_9EURY|nr:hypothetical protein HLRTI_003176 [Halorhabdus tiamatea SARL4B]
MHRVAGRAREGRSGQGRGGTRQGFPHPAILRNSGYTWDAGIFCRRTIVTINSTVTIFPNLVFRGLFATETIDGVETALLSAQSATVLQFVPKGVEDVPAGFREFDLFLAADCLDRDVAVRFERIDDVGVQQRELGLVVGRIGFGHKG